MHTVNKNTYTYTREISLDFRRHVYMTFPDIFIPMIWLRAYAHPCLRRSEDVFRGLWCWASEDQWHPIRVKLSDTKLGPDGYNALWQLFINVEAYPEVLQASLTLTALDISHYSQTQRWSLLTGVLNSGHSSWSSRCQALEIRNW